MRHTIHTVILGVIATMSLSACVSIKPAEMAQPSGLTSAKLYQVAGLGHGRTGTFQIGAWNGAFQRSDDRLAIFDPLIQQRKGLVQFSFNGPSLDGTIRAECSAKERTLQLDFIAMTVSPMAYSCSFRHDGRTLPARFEVQSQSDGVETLMARRAGEIAFDRAIVQIRSSHRIVGTPLPSPTPMGYEFTRAGAPIGSVSFNKGMEVRVVQGTTPEEERAIILASLALGIVWDPAASTLG